jgi:hypothetical protein
LEQLQYVRLCQAFHDIVFESFADATAAPVTVSLEVRNIKKLGDAELLTVMLLCYHPSPAPSLCRLFLSRPLSVSSALFSTIFSSDKRLTKYFVGASL